MLYQSGRNNLALTIFVPYDCRNRCPFCTSKKMYSKKLISMDFIIEQIKQLGNLSLVKDIVFTGGEPFSDLDKLQILIDIAFECNKNIFINTTMPNVEFINKNKNKISGISVSRHIKVKTQEYLDKDLKKIEVPIRINSVLYNITENDIENIQYFIDYYKDYQINFRENYVDITLATLKNVVDNYFINILANNLGLTYWYGGGCQVCNDDVFENNIHYHRGLEYSSFVIGNTTVINDLIIFPTGEVCYDWDTTKIINDKIIKDLNYKI